MSRILDRLLSVKSLITILLSAAFVHQTVTGKIMPDQFMTIYTVIISFYFGTQANKEAVRLRAGDNNTKE